jgi:hypothetical protein
MTRTAASKKRLPRRDKIVDPNNQTIEIDANLDQKIRELVLDEHPGDEHYPGDENTKRISTKKDLPRRT